MSNEILEEKDKVKLILSKIKDNSKKLLSILLIIIFVLIAVFVLGKREESKNILASQEFNKAKILIQNGKKNEGFILLKQIIVEKKHKFYSPLSLYLIIDSKLEKTNEEIIELFDKVISIKKIDKENINLIKIKKALFFLNYDEEQEVLRVLNPIINSDSIWRSNAIEILIDYFSNKGDSLKAEQYRKILNNKDSK